MQSMIFAAGLGTRLKPITDTRPKALVEIGGRTLLERVVGKLRESGASEIVINVHHFAQMIIDYLKAHDNFGMDIRISDESKELLDTGGGIKHAAHLFKSAEPILIHNVDIMSNVDLAKFYQDNRSADATLLVSERNTSRYLLFDDNMRLVGWTNIKTGEVKSPFPNLDPSRYKRYAFSGIHIFSPSLFPLMEESPTKFGIIDFYLATCSKADIRGVVKPDLRLLDVGKLDSLAQAEEFESDNCAL